ncbi:MAG TPA: M20 family metallopeptidase [Anaerolineae bacterium]|nr:M20 family metallopeptidase [Anaerolineae bacterium]
MPTTVNPTALITYLQQHQHEMFADLRRLVSAESPSSDPRTQARPQQLLRNTLDQLGYRTWLIPGQETGGHLLAEPRLTPSNQPKQMLLGHTDTVWPVGTLATMPLTTEDNIMRGPGVYDMKAGLIQIIYALKALHALNIDLSVTPSLFINSDEEIGSPESRAHIMRLAPNMNRALVAEPALGPLGHLKTARKGVGHFIIETHGQAAHAGLDPDKGVSAILEMSHITQKLFTLNEPDNGVSVNVGVINGGMRSNVIAPHCTAEVDVRVLNQADADRLHNAINALQPTLNGTQITIKGKFNRPPMERTDRNQALWHLAQQLGTEIGLDLDQAWAGGGSDGNLTSPYTATLDGLGPIGDGAHAAHEHIDLDHIIPRTALLALLIAAPPL